MLCFSKFDSDREATEAQVSWIHNNIRIVDDKHFTVRSRVEQSVSQKTIRSTLSFKRLIKENEGVYTCESVYANPLLTDMKSIDINLRVQFKPRFPENTPRNVWVSDETQSPVIVNVTCLVNADPIAEFQWFTGRGSPIDRGNDETQSPVIVNVTCLVNADPIAEFQWFTGRGSPIDRGNGGLDVKHRIINTENLSVLSLEYENIGKIVNKLNDPNGHSRQFQCKARNTIGEERITFELNVGKLPEQPIL
ncbi:unnamed protein product, partial [Oppiella nova]